MTITKDFLEHRREQLVDMLQRDEDSLSDLKERAKSLKKEIANLKGAIIEIDGLLEK